MTSFSYYYYSFRMVEASKTFADCGSDRQIKVVIGTDMRAKYFNIHKNRMENFTFTFLIRKQLDSFYCMLPGLIRTYIFYICF